MEPLHPSDTKMTGDYFATIEELRAVDGRITKIKDDPTPIGVTSESVRMCWTCEGAIALASDDFKEVVLQHLEERASRMSRARFCSRGCWETWAGIE